MKKLILIFFTCSLCTVAGLCIYNKCRHVDAATIDTGITINGVTWATRNVATPGKFVTNSYDAGNFYQWNSKVGWPATGTIGHITASDGSTTWNGTWTGGYTPPSSFDTWTSSNDPSPAGWHVPTLAEIKALLDTSKVVNIWTTQNGVYGRKFTDKTTGNSIFLPASSYRNENDGTLNSTELYGSYCCSTADDDYYTCSLLFYSSYNYWNYYSRAIGRSIRPVAD